MPSNKKLQKEVNEHMGSVLKRLLKENKISAESAAAAIGYERGIVWGYIKGRQQIPAHTLLMLCNIFRAEPADFYPPTKSYPALMLNRVSTPNNNK